MRTKNNFCYRQSCKTELILLRCVQISVKMIDCDASDLLSNLRQVCPHFFVIIRKILNPLSIFFLLTLLVI